MGVGRGTPPLHRHDLVLKGCVYSTLPSLGLVTSRWRFHYGGVFSQKVTAETLGLLATEDCKNLLQLVFRQGCRPRLNPKLAFHRYNQIAPTQAVVF